MVSEALSVLETEKRAQFEISIAKTKLKISTLQNDLNKALANADPQQIVETKFDIESYTKGLQTLEETYLELFPKQ